MPEGAVLAHAAQPGREALGEDHLGEQLLGVLSICSTGASS